MACLLKSFVAHDRAELRAKDDLILILAAAYAKGGGVLAGDNDSIRGLCERQRPILFANELVIWKKKRGPFFGIDPRPALTPQ